MICRIMQATADGGDGIHSLAELHMGLMLLSRTMESDDSRSLEEKLLAKEQFCMLCENLCQDLTDCGKIPEFIRNRYQKILNVRLFRKVKSLGRCLYSLKDPGYGFDMAVTEDGEHFERITRDGMGRACACFLSAADGGAS